MCIIGCPKLQAFKEKDILESGMSFHSKSFRNLIGFVKEIFI
jgi:hypothetical protein